MREMWEKRGRVKERGEDFQDTSVHSILVSAWCLEKDIFDQNLSNSSHSLHCQVIK